MVDNTDQQKIGSFIANVRKEKGLTQSELAERIGVTNKTVSRWETGKYMPDLATIPTLCKELNISVNEFISGEHLNDTVFKDEADNNIISILKDKELLLRQKRFSDFFGGAGMRILVGALYSPDVTRKIISICIALTMIGIGWVLRAKLDKNIFIDSSPTEISLNSTPK